MIMNITLTTNLPYHVCFLFMQLFFISTLLGYFSFSKEGDSLLISVSFTTESHTAAHSPGYLYTCSL